MKTILTPDYGTLSSLLAHYGKGLNHCAEVIAAIWIWVGVCLRTEVADQPTIYEHIHFIYF